jgi:hypothetical protein
MVDAAATFSIDVEGTAPTFSKEATKSLEELRASVRGSQDAVKQYSETLRGLTGKSAEVLDAKTKLKAAIDREKSQMSAAGIEILKMGSSYGKLAAEAKKAAAANDNGTRAVKAIGGPLQSGIEKLEKFKEVMGGGNVSAALFAGGLALLTVGVVALTTAAIGGVASLAKWIFTSADAARSLQLVREAATGSAEQAKNLGTQVDALARKVPTAKKELNDLAADLYRRFNNTAASGQVIVDTFNIIAQSSAAMGDTVGKQLGDIIERSKRFGMIHLNPFELQGTGIKFQDVAKNLAKDLNVSIADAQRALFQGRVKLDAGAKALRQTIEDRFGEVNARKLLSFDVILAKWHEALDNLTKGVKIEPLSKAVGDFMGLFDPTKTRTGAQIRELVGLIGNGLVKAFVKLEPLAKAVFKGLVGGALDITIAVLRLGLSWKKTLGAITEKEAMEKASNFLHTLADDLVIAAKAAYYLALGMKAIWGAADKTADAILNFNGVTMKAQKGGDDILARGVKSLFGGGGGGEKSSPPASTAVAPANAEGGQVMRPAAGEAFASVAPNEMIVPVGSTLAGSSSTKAAGSISLVVNFHIGAGTEAKAVAKELASPNILDPLVKALEDALVAAGFPVQTVPQP